MTSSGTQPPLICPSCLARLEAGAASCLACGAPRPGVDPPAAPGSQPPSAYPGAGPAAQAGLSPVGEPSDATRLYTAGPPPSHAPTAPDYLPRSAPGHPAHGTPGYAPNAAPGYAPNAAPGYPPYGAPGYAPNGVGVPGYPPNGAPGYPPYGAPGYASNGVPGYPPYGAPGYPPPVVALAPKSAGVAILLNFLLLGAGNLYAGQTAAGIVLICVDVFLWLTSFLIITLVLTIPLWILFFIIAIATSTSEISSYNANLMRGRY